MSDRPTIEEYRERLRGLSNHALIDEAASAIHASAVMARFRSNSGWDDKRADACYDEAKRRGNLDLYQRGFNIVARSQGYTGMARSVSTPTEVGDPRGGGA